MVDVALRAAVAQGLLEAERALQERERGLDVLVAQVGSNRHRSSSWGSVRLRRCSSVSRASRRFVQKLR